MKIILSKLEAIEYIRRGMGLPHAEIEIVEPADHPWATLLTAVMREFPLPSQKIAAIRAFRAGCGRFEDALTGAVTYELGLADAKWAVENPHEAFANLNKKGQVRE